MNKPVFNAIMRHSPTKPIIIFVPTRKLSVLLAIELVTLSAVAQETKAVSFLHCAKTDLEPFLEKITDKVCVYLSDILTGAPKTLTISISQLPHSIDQSINRMVD